MKPSSLKQPRLDFAVIGVQKSGSTYVQDCLKAHPDLWMPKGESAVFLDGHYEESLRVLHREFPVQEEGVLYGIKRPEYLLFPECAHRIHRHFPSCKLIAVLREPVQRAVSAYFHLMSIGYIPVIPLEKGFQSLLDGSLQQKYPKAQTILDFGFYSQGVSTYLKLFPDNQRFFCLHDDIQQDAKGALATICAFLGVEDASIPVDVLEKRPRASVYSLPRQRLIQFANKRIQVFSPDGLSYRMKSSPSWLDRTSRKLARKLDARVLAPMLSNSRPVLPPETTHRLQAYFKEDVRKLEPLIGHDLSHWLHSAM